MSRLSEVAPEEVAAVLYDELDALEVEEVWGRAGSTRHGYVEQAKRPTKMIEYDRFGGEDIGVGQQVGWSAA